jgi:F-type H+-transporting ATPase subunit b
MSLERSFPHLLRRAAFGMALVLALAADLALAQEATHGATPPAQEPGRSAQEPGPSSQEPGPSSQEPGIVEQIYEAEGAVEPGHADAAHGEGAGMPQLDAGTFLSQIFWLILTFGFLYWLFRTRALPKVSEVLEARQDRIASDLDRAAALRAEAEAAAQKQEEVVAQAHARAQTRVKELQDRLAADAARRQAALDAELGGKLGEAEARVSGARQAALAEVRGVAVEAAQAAAKRLAGLDIGRETAEAALDGVVREAA